MILPQRDKQPERMLDIEAFATWVKRCREELGWSMETVARELTTSGYPTSHNKLWRLENYRKSRLKKIDLELKLRLENLFGQTFSHFEPDSVRAGNLVRLDEVLAVIDIVKELGRSAPPPEDAALRRIYQRLVRN
jgi:transcriptional regulator with XRE-family HTH domain